MRTVNKIVHYTIHTIQLYITLVKTDVLNSDGTTGQLMPTKRPSTWPDVGLMTEQSPLAAGMHCPVVLTISTPNSIDNCAEREH